MGLGGWSSLAWGHIWSLVSGTVMVHRARAAATQDLAALIITGSPGRAELRSGQSKTIPSDARGREDL